MLRRVGEQTTVALHNCEHMLYMGFCSDERIMNRSRKADMAEIALCATVGNMNVTYS
jgi:hypothetical protein